MRTTRAVGIVVVAIALLAAVPVLGQAADAQPAPAAQAAVDIDLKDVSVADAVAALFKGTGKTYKLEPGVTGTIVELRLKGISFDEGLRALANAAGLRYEVVDGVYKISPKPAEPATTGSGPTATEAAPTAVAPATTPSAATGGSDGVEVPGAEMSEADAGSTVIINQPNGGPIYYGHPGPDIPYSYYPGIMQFGNVQVITRYRPLLIGPGGRIIVPGGYEPPLPRLHPQPRPPRNPGFQMPISGLIR